MLQICRAKRLQSAIKLKTKCCMRGAMDAVHVAENIFNRACKIVCVIGKC